MITIRPEKPDDQSGIQEVDASATATLRRTYRPSQKAIANKTRISKLTSAEMVMQLPGKEFVDES